VFPTKNLGSGALEIKDSLEEYYRKELSYESDALHAFLGIFRAHHQSPFPSLSPRANHFYAVPMIEVSGQSLRSLTKSFAVNLAWMIETNPNATNNCQLRNPDLISDLYPS
jgi:hypothetical protein